MSQRNVEWIIGRLVTDEAFRRRFAESPEERLQELIAWGISLTPCELRALRGFDTSLAARCAGAVDPRLLKADLHCGGE